MAKRICLMTFYPTDCKDDCFNCECGGAEATKDMYVSIHDVQRVCAITGGASDTDEGEYVAEVIRNNLEHMVISLADVRTVDKWISVKDRLPETNAIGVAHVLAYDSYEGVVKADFLDESANYRYGSNIFQISNTSTQLYKVSHWQPLPESPKKGDING